MTHEEFATLAEQLTRDRMAFLIDAHDGTIRAEVEAQ